MRTKLGLKKASTAVFILVNLGALNESSGFEKIRSIQFGSNYADFVIEARERDGNIFVVSNSTQWSGNGTGSWFPR